MSTAAAAYAVQRQFIGTITPSGNTVVERITQGILRELPQASGHFSRTPVFGTSDPSPDAYATEGLLSAARLLAHAAPRVIVWNGSKGAGIGFEHDRVLVRQITLETGIAATTSVLGLDALCRARDIRRIAVLTPYNDAASQKAIDCLQAEGYDCVAEAHAGLSDILIRDLTALRTLGLRLALSEQPEIAVVAVTHALSAQIFYRGADAHALDIRPASTMLASHADGIEDTKAGKAWADHHARWAAQMPRDVCGLWTFIVELDPDSRMALFAHCAALTVNAVKLPTERRRRAMATADRLAEAVSLDMTAHWIPTARTYFGRVTKPHILAAVREAVGIEAADRMADMKKQDMAEAAEQLVIATGWLPVLMRTSPALTSPSRDYLHGVPACTPSIRTSIPRTRVP